MQQFLDRVDVLVRISIRVSSSRLTHYRSVLSYKRLSNPRGTFQNPYAQHAESPRPRPGLQVPQWPRIKSIHKWLGKSLTMFNTESM
jgi:hypothetical protein